MVRAVALSFESELAGGCELLTCFTILLICDNPHENFIFHQESIISLLKSNKELESALFGAPGMTTARALEFEVATLFSLQHEKFISVPLLLVLDSKYFGKGFLTGPLDLDPLKRRAVRRHRDILMPIYVCLNLFDVSLGRLRLNSLVVEWWLEPICHLENIPCF